MTLESRPLGDLVRDLEQRGMLRSVLAPPGAPLAAVEVRGVAFDSRAAQARDALRGRPRRRSRRPRLRRGRRPERGVGGRCRARHRATRRAADPGRLVAFVARPRGGVDQRPSEPLTGRGRRDRHGRQDDDLVPGPRHARRVRPAGRADQHDRGDRRRREPRLLGQDDARGTAHPVRPAARWSTRATDLPSSSRRRMAWHSNASPRLPTTWRC